MCLENNHWSLIEMIQDKNSDNWFSFSSHFQHSRHENIKNNKKISIKKSKLLEKFDMKRKSSFVEIRKKYRYFLSQYAKLLLNESFAKECKKPVLVLKQSAKVATYSR